MDLTMHFRERLVRLGMPFGDEQLGHAHALVTRDGFVPEELSDIQLMTMCVEAYRQPDSDLPMWI
ncbi:MAG: hypothetical protein ABR525_04275 [Candidatus Limnocylindria bacterium]